MSQLSVNAILDANGGNTATINSMTPTADSLQGFRNRIINGDMRISQAAAGSSITPASSGANASNFAVDRFRIAYSQNSKLTAQQNAGSVTPPAGFKNYLGVSVSTTATVGASDFFLVGQAIEGFNLADLEWGTANAKPITISFWTYSNTTGTFGGAINNSAYNRAYPFTYAISSANTWEYKTVSLSGDTTGTWLTTNGVGAYVWFSLGTGSSRSTTASSWASGEYYSATGATSLMGSTSNYLYITGVQLEVGSVATPFERRPFGAELALCQRYFYKHAEGSAKTIAIGGYYSSTSIDTVVFMKVSMRAAPSLVQTTGSNYYRINRNGGSDEFDSFDIIDRVTTEAAQITSTANISGTAGHVGLVITNNASSSLAFSAEL
jgi:hypothetical protein